MYDRRAMSDDGLVIVGASLAGAKAAEGARSQGWTQPIRLVGAEPHMPYERPPISKDVLMGREAPVTASVHDNGYYVSNDIDLLLGGTVGRVDLAERRIVLNGERQIRFAKLILATGSSPRRLDLANIELPEVFYLRTLDDALALRDRLLPGSRLGVIGASWIGTEVASSARQRGSEVVMIDPLSTPLERVLGPEVGRFFDQLHRGHGVDMRLGVGLDAIEGSDHVTGVKLTDGTVIEVDTVLVGIGVTPNIELAREAGLSVGGGVLVDSTLVASHPDVCAAGDIAEAEHPTFGGRIRVEHWANALNQGLAAGKNAAGATVVYDRIPYFYSDQYDMGMEYSGWPVTWDNVAFRGDPEQGEFVAFYMKDGHVVGGANFNVWDVNEQVQAIIRAGAHVDLDVLTDPGISPDEWTAQT
jgi:3-phenylpropionate/trans-cinnamate dioxygenase ferredoxin reductase component